MSVLVVAEHGSGHGETLIVGIGHRRPGPVEGSTEHPEPFDDGAHDRRVLGNLPQAYSHLGLIGNALTLDRLAPYQRQSP